MGKIKFSVMHFDGQRLASLYPFAIRSLHFEQSLVHINTVGK